MKKYKKENSDFDLKVPTNCLPIETIASLIYGLQYKLNEAKYKEDVTNFRNVLDSICEEICKDKDNNVIDVLPVFHYIGNKLIQLTHDIINNISSFIDSYKEKPKQNPVELHNEFKKHLIEKVTTPVCETLEAVFKCIDMPGFEISNCCAFLCHVVSDKSNDLMDVDNVNNVNNMDDDVDCNSELVSD